MPTNNRDVWLAYVDEEDNGSRENWSVFYCDPIIGYTQASVKTFAKTEVTRLATELCQENEDPLTEVSHYANMFHIYIVGPITPKP